jgi:hypothetical protein
MEDQKMRHRLSISIILASMLALTFITVGAQQGQGGGGSGDRDQQMDRDYDRDMDQDRDRVQDRDRLHITDPASLREEDIYGSTMMTDEELRLYRNQLENMETVEAREHYQIKHEAKMQERAQLQGKDLVPPGQGPIYGGELMTVQERNEYREQLRHMDSEEEREKFQAQHHEQMNLRAKALELDIEEAE